MADLRSDDNAAGIGASGTCGWTALVIAASLALLTTIIYWPVATFDFVRLDDNIHVFSNPFLASHASLGSLWLKPYEGLYIPVTYTLLALIAPLARMESTNHDLTDTGALFNPHVFHAANLLLHVLNVVLAFVVLRRLIKSDAASGLGALVFAVHPLQVESVAWVSEVRGLLAAAFGFGAILAYVSWSERPKSRVFYALASGVCIIAVLCKPSAICLPLVLFVIDALIVKRPWRTAALAVLPIAVLLVPIILLTQSQQPLPADRMTPIWTRPLVALDALSFYAGKVALPINLAVDYGRSPVKVMRGPAFFTWTVPVILAITAWRVRGRAPALGIGMLLFVAALSPVLGLIPFRFQGASTVADRYVYFAMFGLSYFVASIAARAHSGASSSGVLLLAFIYFLHSPSVISTWKNTVTLFSHSLSVNPNSPLLENNLAFAYQDRGQPEAALVHFDNAIKLDPGYFGAQNNRAGLLLATGKSKEALAAYFAILNRWPNSRAARIGVARTYEALGKADQAMATYNETIRLYPDYEDAYVRSAILMAATGKLSEADRFIAGALRLNPRNGVAWVVVGNIASVRNRPGDALRAYAHAAVCDPNNYEAQYNLGVLAIQARDLDRATKALRQAVAARPFDADAHDMLGVAYYDAGDRAKAAEQFRAALKIEPTHASALDHLAAMYRMP